MKLKNPLQLQIIFKCQFNRIHFAKVLLINWGKRIANFFLWVDYEKGYLLNIKSLKFPVPCIFVIQCF